MYNSQDIADRIKKSAAIKGVSLGVMFSDLGLSNNTLHNMKTSFPKSNSIALIADYLGVSVDYLLGRTDSPTLTPSNAETSNFTGMFDSLSAEDKVKTINFMMNLRR